MVNTNKLNAEQHEVVMGLCKDSIALSDLLLSLLDMGRTDIMIKLVESNPKYFRGTFMDSDTKEVTRLHD
jgi:hypothetical protein